MNTKVVYESLPAAVQVRVRRVAIDRFDGDIANAIIFLAKEGASTNHNNEEVFALN